MNITVYTNQRIDRLVSCSVGLVEIQCLEGEEYIEGHYHLDEYYIQDGQPVARPTMQPPVSTMEVAADGIEEVLITNLPIPATVNVKGQLAEIDDGELVLTFDTPGTYRLAVEAFPCKPWEVTIHAT